MPETAETSHLIVRNLLTAAWLLPLAAFIAQVYAVECWSNRLSRASGLLGCAAIGGSLVLSLLAVAFFPSGSGSAHTADDGSNHAAVDAEHEAHPSATPAALAGRYYTLARFGDSRLELGWYVDSLTLVLFVVIGLIASCVHVFSLGYLDDERTEDYRDEHAHAGDEQPVSRAGRFHLFFAYLSLFCFSMFGLVLAGNLLQVFAFWELVGFCSYLLIGFYRERPSAVRAANKAILVNRVGDFGFLIGLAVLWTSVGTLQFATEVDSKGVTASGLFEQVRGDGQLELSDDSKSVVLQRHLEAGDEPAPTRPTIAYTLFVLAGLGIVAGSIGKSAQFPLQTWLPDAMEGPTPVSALVHSATMVAAGVYLVARCYPLLAPEVLLVVAYVGAATLFIGATIALTATELKQVLAFSTISQLGYMMLALGVGGWGAGVFHLSTHAFFKSLLFLSAGSVILACHHEQRLDRLGGLRHRLPWTAAAMLIGTLAVTGVGIPNPWAPGYSLALSGFHSKDMVLASALAFVRLNPLHSLLYLVPLAGAGITAVYMFRLWLKVFVGRPADQHVFEHAKESPPVVLIPLAVLAFFSVFSAVGGESSWLYRGLVTSEPAFVAASSTSSAIWPITHPGHEEIHAAHGAAGLMVWLVAMAGAGIAIWIFGYQPFSADELRATFPRLRQFLLDRWRFDALYDLAVVQPVLRISRQAIAIDRTVIDPLLHGASRLLVQLAGWGRRIDELLVDGAVVGIGAWTWRSGERLRRLQSGQLRQYVLWLGLSVVVLFGVVTWMRPG
ncbi:MAG: NADH-quinone oxidoreductase subunit L [Planctomycetaceae bacterium]|nr:NADH-quinone oxidoreductase subunit L [Planctomycetaceae bacterium]